jgi:hypothetical protein
MRIQKSSAAMSISDRKIRHRTVSAGGLNLFVREAGTHSHECADAIRGFVAEASR